jgi:hypothetical protein
MTGVRQHGGKWWTKCARVVWRTGLLAAIVSALFGQNCGRSQLGSHSTRGAAGAALPSDLPPAHAPSPPCALAAACASPRGVSRARGWACLASDVIPFPPVGLTALDARHRAPVPLARRSPTRYFDGDIYLPRGSQRPAARPAPRGPAFAPAQLGRMQNAHAPQLSRLNERSASIPYAR